MFIARITAILALVYSLSLTATGDDGRGIDPNGGRTSAIDKGCMIDPNGGACTSAFGDRGAGLDPNG
jgi:hypothetical protein